jgi:peptidoglycan/xylan/chitin deacetylase (PgdA/CDA1 family)
MRARAALGGALATAGVIQCAPAIACHAPWVSDLLSLRRRLGFAGAVALTFDDGPHPEGTARVLSTLGDRGASATFFLVGEQVRRRPALAREIAAGGHSIGLHGHTHRCELRLTPSALADDWARGLDAIHTATGVLPSILRPPYGAASGAGIELARRAGLEVVLWSRWGRDWRSAATADTVHDVVVRAGSLEREIVLLHDADHYAAHGSWLATVAALPRILDRCEEQGLATVSL